MKNIGSVDKIIRFILAFALAAIAYKFQNDLGVYFWVLLAGAVIAFGTALINFCPLYSIFGIKTCKID